MMGLTTRSDSDRPLPDTICAVPWLNLSLDVNGTCRPCCKYEQESASTVRDHGNLCGNTLMELWNSPGMISLRRDFREGLKPKECSQCWREEDAGIKSLRQEFAGGRINQTDVDFNNFAPESPKALDLKLSNRCNLKCRICGPVASSLWLKEEEAFAPDQISSLLAQKDFFLSNKVTQNTVNRQTFIEWLPQIEHIELFGGEPLISQENRELEELIIENKSAHRISLHYNTNITVFLPEMVRRWREFRRVTLCLSLDDIGPRLEYERYPSKWKLIQDNLQRYSEINDGQIQAMLFCSVSNYNVFYLPEYLEWVAQNLPKVNVRFNLVHDSPEFCVANLPDSVKNEVRSKLSRPVPQAERHIEGATFSEKLREVCSFMDARPGNPEVWRLFFEHTEKIDARRGQSFRDVFSEFFGVVRNGSSERIGSREVALW